MNTKSDNDRAGHKSPPSATRFRKGQSGNPAGRPKKATVAPQASAFDIVIDRRLTITQGGRPRDVTIEEALQHKTYQDAIAGSRIARREVLKMIAKREQALAARQPRPTRPGLRLERKDPANAEAALLILGIAGLDPRWAGVEGHDRRLLLEPWAVQAALSRRGRRPLGEREVAGVERCTRDPETLVWPNGDKH